MGIPPCGDQKDILEEEWVFKAKITQVEEDFLEIVFLG